jgi:hypothetical protein
MTEPQFDPNHFFNFDLARGEVRSRDDGRVLIVTESALAALIAIAVRSGDLTAVRELGNQLGKRASEQMGKLADELSPNVVVAHASSVVALYGWGGLRLERWGNAMVVEVEKLPPLDRENLAVAALLGGLFSTLGARDVACVPIEGTHRYVMVDPSIAEQVWGWSKSGDDLPAIIAKLAGLEKS